MVDREVIVDVENVAKSFGGLRAVVDCSLSVRASSIVGLIGPNGAGKSTVIELISGFIKPDTGTITLGGREIQGWQPHRIGALGLSRTFQSPREWKSLTVMENMLAAARQDGRDALGRAFWGRRSWARVEASDRVRARSLLEELGLTSVKNEFAGNLSGGQKRLLELARLAMAGGKVVLLDEPLAGVNPVLQQHILEAVKTLRSAGVACLVVEHNLPWIERLCDRIFVMALGETIANGRMDELRTNRAVIDAYLGEVAGRA